MEEDRDFVTCVKDGVEINRLFSSWKVINGIHLRSPALRAGEKVVWVLGDDRPHIIQEHK